MKVLNLRCGGGHAFEGWFGSEDDFQSQSARGLIGCPLCADTAIEKRPSAPRLNVGRLRETPSAPVPAGDVKDRWVQHLRRLMASTEDVGVRFPEEARRIHYGETAERAIRGQATREETEALRDEGIEIVSVPIPPALKEPLQ